jgi:hypothetical protein
MSTASAPLPVARNTFLHKLNGRYHQSALNVFMVIVVAHWAEHIAQAVQIWALGWKTPEAKGVLGLYFPWLVTSEWMHYGYALIMLIGLFLLRGGFTGGARTWWDLALVVQLWHHIEHLLLLIQASTHTTFFGGVVPTSVAQTLFPRVELHLFYNTIVTLPMIVAIVLHHRANRPGPRRGDEKLGSVTS